VKQKFGVRELGSPRMKQAAKHQVGGSASGYPCKKSGKHHNMNHFPLGLNATEKGIVKSVKSDRLIGPSSGGEGE
jgi:hypothetical protein